MTNRFRDGAMIAGMVLAWSVYYAVSKRLVDGIGSAYAVGALLRSGALVFLTVQVLADGSWRTLLRPGRALPLLLTVGAFGFLLDLFANLGYAGGSLSTGTALLKTDVLMVNLVTVAVMHRRLTAADWAGTLVMLFGVLLVLGVDVSGAALRPTDLFFLASAACVTANAFLIKHLQTRYDAGSDTVSYYNNLVVLALFWVFTLSRGDLQRVSPDGVPGFWPLVGLGGLAQTGIYFFYYRNLRRHEVWIVKLWLLLMPVVSCLIGVAFLGDTLTGRTVLGIAVVLSGAALILLRDRLTPDKRREAKPHAL